MHMITSLQLHWSPIIYIGAVVVVIVCQLDLQQPVQSVLITTNVESSNLARGEVYSIQHYVIMFVSDLQQVSGSLRVLRFPLLRKLTTTI
jgi:hypothetical protein